MRTFLNVSPFLTLSLICLAFFTHMYSANPTLCLRCTTPEECNLPPSAPCEWGEHTNICQRRVCSKGPGESCGGPSKILGICGEGLYCKHDLRCHGCSSQTWKCFD